MWFAKRGCSRGHPVSHVKLVVIVLVTVLVPAAVALTYMAARNLDGHRYELENTLREQYGKSLGLLDRRIARRLDLLEADISAAIAEGPAQKAAVRAVQYWDRAPHLAHVDLLDSRGEPPPLADTLNLPRPERCEVNDRWREMSMAASLAFANGRPDEAAAFYKSLADSRSSASNCPICHCPTSKCRPFLHLLGLLGQLRSSLVLGDTAGTVARARHLLSYHLADPEPDCEAGLMPPLLDAWYANTRTADARECLAARLRAVVDQGAAGGTAKAELADYLGWRPEMDQARAAGLWHQSAGNLIRTAPADLAPGRFLRLAHPDLILLAVGKQPDGGFATYRVDRNNWKPEIEAILADTPDDTVVELTDAAGTRLAGTGELQAGADLVQTRPLNSVPGWHLMVGPRDPARLAAAAERLAFSSLSMVGLVFVSLCAGVGLLLVNYFRQARLARMQTEFVSGVSHELKTPLALLRMSAETLWMGRFRTDDEARELKRRIVVDTERLSRMVGRVLEFSKLERKQPEFAFRSVDLREVVGDVLEQYRPQLEEMGAEVVLLPPLCEGGSGGDPLPPVQADAEALRQVINNLLDNALKYCDDKPRISISAIAEGGVVKLSIADRGIGMDAETRKRIFDKFYRGTDPAVQRHRGTGLGLAIVQQIVAFHGGDVDVQSAPGAGSTFTVSLPVSEGAAKGGADPKRKPQA